MNSKMVLYQRLELLPSGSLYALNSTRLWQALRRLGGQLVHVLAFGEEPRIRTRQDQNGQTVFDAYDPVTHRHIRNVSEDTLRLWLEQRYYQTLQ
ncbi:MAG: hypothetical protein AAGH78_05535 [Cyanobacteria bacterium P01_H01_bin.58]